MGVEPKINLVKRALSPELNPQINCLTTKDFEKYVSATHLIILVPADGFEPSRIFKNSQLTMSMRLENN